jgi:uncharacterized membrane protein YeaQ/YmgE (transglycosylase-associated protein family)
VSLVIWTILIGFTIGVIARALLPGRDEGGFLLTTGLGISGALLGSIMGRAFGMYGPRDPSSMIMSVIGAVLLLAVYRRYVSGAKTVAR